MATKKEIREACARARETGGPVEIGACELFYESMSRQYIVRYMVTRIGLCYYGRKTHTVRVSTVEGVTMYYGGPGCYGRRTIDRAERRRLRAMKNAARRRRKLRRALAH